MIRFATIGTNWITHKFIDAAHQTQEMQLHAVYSRDQEHAKHFAAPYLVDKLYTNLDELAKDTAIDAVYIASPNSFHCEQAIKMMQHKKHVFCEKPLASNLHEVQRMFAVAQQHGVILFEGYKTEYLPNTQILKKNLQKIGTLHRAYIHYCQYSSRYPRYLAGENPNTFNPKFANGSMVDIGYYCLAFALSLFGRPTALTTTAKLLTSGVDAHGTVILHYPTFEVILAHSKVSDGYLPSELQGENGVLTIEHVSQCQTVYLQLKNQAAISISVPQKENSMYYEAYKFIEQIKTNRINEQAKALSLLTAEILTEIRKQIGVHYPADDLMI